MCEGFYVECFCEILVGCFKICMVVGAYWWGDSDNIMMMWFYVWVFEICEELDVYVKVYKEVLVWDYKKLGKEFDFFIIDDIIGKGFPFWFFNGTIIRDELEKLVWECEFVAGYERVCMFYLIKVDLYY